MEATQELLFKIADDALIMGHTDSSWTGLGPTLEEDIAFSSMSQDKIGHAWNLFQMLHDKFGMDDADTLGFKRAEKAYKCSHLTEVPTQDYAYALVRQFFFDHGQFMRFSALKNSSIEWLADFSRKVTSEIKYHTLHGDTWLKKLGAQGNEESKARMQSAINEVFPLALGYFEEGPHEAELIEKNIFIGEKALQKAWLEKVADLVSQYGLTLPDVNTVEPSLGGRNGYHTEHLQPLLAEMTEVTASDPEATW